MGPISVFYIAFAAISLFACFIQLFISYRKRGELIFIVGALLSFLVFLNFTAKFLCSTNIGNLFTSFSLLRCQLILNQAVGICMLGVLFYLKTEQKRLDILLHVSVLFSFIIFSLIVPDSFLFGENTNLRSVSLRYGDTILLLDSKISIWRIMMNLSILAFFISAIILLSRKMVLPRLRTVIALNTGLGLILLAAVYDQFIDIGHIESAYLLPFSLFVFYLVLLFITFGLFIQEVINQQKIIQQEQKWRNMINEVKVIVVELNRMGHVEFVNPYFSELSGYKNDEVIGKDWFEFFIPPKEFYNVQGAFIEILDYEFHPHYYNPILTKSKEELIIQWFNVRKRDRDGKITGSLSVGVNVSKEISEKEDLANKLQEAEWLITKLSKKDNS